MDAFVDNLRQLLPDGNVEKELLIKVLKAVDPSLWNDENIESMLGSFPEAISIEHLAEWLDFPKVIEPQEASCDVIDLKRYTEPESIWHALATGSVRLVRASWLVQQSKMQQVLPRRQELPHEAFIDVEELKRIYGKGNPDGVLPIVAISFCWLTPEHPDPRAQQLAKVAAHLEREQSKYGKFFLEMGVFWDWLSLYQKDKKDKRTAAEQLAFGFALHETMDLWYAHQGTTVYMLTQLSEGCDRKVGYADSGWTTYERCSAEQIKKFFLGDQLGDTTGHAAWKLVIDLGADEDAQQAARNWPIGPDDFDELINSKKFTNGADKNNVKILFRKMSEKQLGGIEELSFRGMKTPNSEDARHLGGCLNLCKSLTRLVLAQIELTDEACTSLFSTLAEGALPSCQLLKLNNNKIGDEGMRAFSDALGKGALASCQELSLAKNGVGDEGMRAFSEEVCKGALARCQHLYLFTNAIGDEGMRAFSEALGKRALASCKRLFLFANKIGDEGMRAFSEALGKGALVNCERLDLDDNAIGDEGRRVFAEARGQGALAGCYISM